MRSQTPCPGGSQPCPASSASGSAGRLGFILDTNPLERVNGEVKRRADVVGIFPDDAPILRLASGLLVEMNDEWVVAHRYLSLHSMSLLEVEGHGPCGPADADRPALKGPLAGAGKSTT